MEFQPGDIVLLKTGSYPKWPCRVLEQKFDDTGENLSDPAQYQVPLSLRKMDETKVLLVYFGPGAYYHLAPKKPPKKSPALFAWSSERDKFKSYNEDSSKLPRSIKGKTRQEYIEAIGDALEYEAHMHDQNWIKEKYGEKFYQYTQPEEEADENLVAKAMTEIPYTTSETEVKEIKQKSVTVKEIKEETVTMYEEEKPYETLSGRRVIRKRVEDSDFTEEEEEDEEYSFREDARQAKKQKLKDLVEKKRSHVIKKKKPAKLSIVKTVAEREPSANSKVIESKAIEILSKVQIVENISEKAELCIEYLALTPQYFTDVRKIALEKTAKYSEAKKALEKAQQYFDKTKKERSEALHVVSERVKNIEKLVSLIVESKDSFLDILEDSGIGQAVNKFYKAFDMNDRAVSKFMPEPLQKASEVLKFWKHKFKEKMQSNGSSVRDNVVQILTCEFQVETAKSLVCLPIEEAIFKIHGNTDKGYQRDIKSIVKTLKNDQNKYKSALSEGKLTISDFLSDVLKPDVQ